MDKDSLNVTKEVDVDAELAAIEDNKGKEEEPELERIVVSNRRSPTKNLGKDPAFVKSLKAQGFEETSSKTKLVYDFKKTPQGARTTSPNKTMLSSPTRNAVEARPTSPFKPHPLQFVSPQVNKAMSQASPSTGASSASSPGSAAKKAPANSVSRPPKPARTWAAVQVKIKRC